MPGIFGVISKERHILNAYSNRISFPSCQYEQICNTGSYVNEKIGLFVSWTNHPKTFSDCLPIKNEKEDIVLIFSGENFIDKNKLNWLKTRGHSFNENNASYLVHLYEEYENDDFFKQLNGLFCGILIDLRQNKIILFNDRYGMYRIYYYLDNDIFIFSTEAKYILSLRPELKHFDMQSLGEYFTCDCVLENRTLFKGISLLPPGSAWSFSNIKSIEKKQYFNTVDYESQRKFNFEEYFQEIKHTFSQKLPFYFNSPQKIGMSLTGGIDTRMIMAGMQHTPGSLPCYTFAGPDRDCYDVIIAKKIAELCEQPHYKLVLDKKYLHDFATYAEKSVYITEGSLNVTCSYELYLNRLAREIAPIRMTGNYGSEVLRNVGSLKADLPDLGIFDDEFSKHLIAAKSTLDTNASGNPLTMLLTKRIPWQMNGRFKLEQSQLTTRIPFLDNDIVQLAYKMPDENCSNSKMSLNLIRDYNFLLSKIPTDQGIGGICNPIFSKILSTYRQATFKAEYVYNYGMPQWLAKTDHLFAPFHLEKLFLGRHKFQYFRIWFRDYLADYLKGILLDKNAFLRTYMKNGIQEEIVTKHINGTGNYTTEIDKLLTIEIVNSLLLKN